MNLVEIAKGISVNPEKVIAVKLQSDWETYKDDQGITRGRWTKEKFAYVYTQEIDGEYSESASLMYSAKEKSDFSYKDTINMLTEGDSQ